MSIQQNSYIQALKRISQFQVISFPEIYEAKSLRKLHILFPHITIEELTQSLERIEDIMDEVHSIAAPPVFVKDRFQGIMFYPDGGTFRLNNGLVVSKYTMQNLWLRDSAWTPDYWEEALNYKGWALRDASIDDVCLSFEDSTERFLLEYNEHIDRRNFLESLNKICPIASHHYISSITEELRSEHYWQGSINMQIDLIIDRKTGFACKSGTDCDLYPENHKNYFVNKSKNIPEHFSIPNPIKEMFQSTGVL